MQVWLEAWNTAPPGPAMVIMTPRAGPSADQVTSALATPGNMRAKSW